MESARKNTHSNEYDEEAHTLNIFTSHKKITTKGTETITRFYIYESSEFFFTNIKGNNKPFYVDIYYVVILKKN